TYRFVDIPDGMPAEQVVDALAAQGFTLEERDQDGDYWFLGQVMGWDTQVLAFMTAEGTATKFIIRLLTPDADAFPVYDDMIEVLVAKYGAPSLAIREFEEP